MINLSKGGNLNLSKESTSTTFTVGLSWEANTDTAIKDKIDIDVYAIITNPNDKGAKEEEVRFFNNIDGTGKQSSVHYKDMTQDQAFAEAKKLSANSVVVLSLDCIDGDFAGDDETLFVNSLLLKDDQKITIAINIYEAKTRGQLFGMVKKPFCKIYDSAGAVIASYDIGEDFPIETGILVGEFYKVNGDTKFKSKGTGFQGDINDLLKMFI